MARRRFSAISALAIGLIARAALADIGPIAVPPFSTGFFPLYTYTATNQAAGQSIHGMRLVADWEAGTPDAWSAFFRTFPTGPGNKVGSALGYGGLDSGAAYHFDAARYLVFPAGTPSGGDWKFSFSMTLPGTSAALTNVGVTLLDNEVASYSATTLGGSTWHRPHEGFTSVDSEVVSYHVQPFTVDASGRYDLYSSQSFDGMLFLYAGSFDPTSPLSFQLADNDDGRTGTMSSDIWLDVAGAPLMLAAGQTYYLVTTGFRPEDVGGFSNYIGGVGQVTFVPEPGGISLVFAGLAATLRPWRRRGRP